VAWGNNEPDGHESENCAVTTPAGAWADIPCHLGFVGMCEGPRHGPVPGAFANWGDGQPSVQSFGPSCAKLDTASGHWSAVSCGRELPYVCATPRE
jgi:hypothetical protein